MKAIHYIGAGVAVFVGALGALQVNRQLEKPAVVANAQKVPVEYQIEPAQFSAGGAVDFRAAAQKVNKSVVSIDRFNNATDFFGEPVGEQETGSGSGVVIGANGIIVTNNHVVADATRVQVRTSDGRSLDAKVLGTDPVSDLAVLQVSGANLPAVPMGNSKDLQVGQWVMAVGNPLGFDNTVSVGVVSSLKRSLPIQGSALVDAIQTDAAINPGNSGGALTDASGNLIGINSAIASNNRGSIGIGFAIPVDRVQKVVNDIVKFGYTRYPGLGIRYRKEWDGALAFGRVRRQIAQETSATEVPNSGIIIAGAEGEAAKAGIGTWDILLSIDGQKTESLFDLNRVLVPKKPGDVVTIKVWSKGQEKTIKIALQELRRDV